MLVSVSRSPSLPAVLPGLFLCAAVTLMAQLLERLQLVIFGAHWIESLVLAILIGIAVRSSVRLPQSFTPGIHFAAKTLLEIAVVLLGASLSAAAIRQAGLPLVCGIAVLVALSLAGSFLIGRLLGLSTGQATLVACGNSICGNSAIAAAAPVIGAKPDDIAASIAFTALLGVGAVLALPLLHLLLGLSTVQYGVFAGLTAYAVPQVLAATASAGAVSTQVGTLVKLIRVMMLGPVILVLGALHGRRATGSAVNLRHLLPWFILGFAAMATLRSFDAIPAPLLTGMSAVSAAFTVTAMAALGLSVDVRSVARTGGRILAAAALSLLALAALGLCLMGLLDIG
ncbi:putative sulfate exporter family transporter [Rhizobium lentis]|uniref:YeiH family protein n=1 Tax=Rhizobium lentis TaxID=1138194 RepID=UPI001A931498|nr:putative sulfate exporter family transporter [Rhizobium lentis]MBX4976955.1 putative sulfate exporter family transporter [Rhizobium lentis]MBX5000748.1 putative sulfate exporter family transporter [Rhizobium lentis]MBX5019209.1 putative sulfate exporter family transporter [Rhizobium lentis]MBX5031826.1 putative sulfate exporter family transporter [Rhizobium lentis]MBX5037918.1 putative sulfate exporter family transporter [Rhizobium lentis]